MITVGVGLLDPAQMREVDAEAFTPDMAPHMLVAIEAASLAWRVDHGGAFIFALWVVPEPYPGLRRGWLQMAFGRAVDEVPARVWGRGALRFHRAIMAARPFDELRAWVDAADDRAIRFAEAMGFRYDAGPATGYTFNGHDANLMLWRADDGRSTRGRRRGEARGGRAAQAGQPGNAAGERGSGSDAATQRARAACAAAWPVHDDV